MCTLVLTIRPSQAWPILIAANRDEKLDRPWLPPAEHWPEHPGVIGGMDQLAGGTWLAVNQRGVVAAVLNRLGTLGPAPGKRSRGELPLMALRHNTAAEAALEVSRVNAGLYRSFNLIIADQISAFWLCGTGHGRVDRSLLIPGTHIVTARDPNDVVSPRVARNLPVFRTTPAPEPPDWSGWIKLLSDNTPPAEAAINIPPFGGFGTSSSALIGLGTGQRSFMFAPGPPHTTAFSPVAWP